MSSLLVSAPISAAIALCAYFFVVPSDLKIYIGGQVKSAPMQERLQATTAEREAYQTELLSERAQFQNLKLQVEGLQATITSLREEIANVRASEDEKRLELKRRLEKQVRDRDEDLVLMENQLGERKKDIMEKRGELDKMQIELENVRARAAVAATSHAAATKSHEEAAAFLQRDLVESRDRNEKTEAVLVVVRRDLETSRAELARHVNSLAEAQATAEANAARADLLQEKILSWRPAASAEDKASVMGWSLLCFLVVVGSFSFLARRLSQALQAQQEGSAHTPSGGQGQSGRSNSHRRATSAPAAPGRYTIRNHTGSMSSTSRVATPPVPVSSGQVPLPRFGRLPEISLVPTPTSHSGAPLRSGAPPGTSLDSDDRMSARCNMSTQARSRSTSPSAQDLDETIDISKLLGAAAPNETKAEASSSSTARAQCTDPDDFLEERNHMVAILCIECGVNPGRLLTDGLCSYCFRELVMRENAAMKKRKEEAKIRDQETRMREEARRKEEEELEDRKQKNTTRCYKCGKKTGLTGFECKCGYIFCSAHRHAEDHACVFDHKAHGRQILAQQNPKVQNSSWE